MSESYSEGRAANRSGHAHNKKIPRGCSLQPVEAFRGYLQPSIKVSVFQRVTDASADAANYTTKLWQDEVLGGYSITNQKKKDEKYLQKFVESRSFKSSSTHKTETCFLSVCMQAEG